MEIVRQRTIEGEVVKTVEFIPDIRDHGFAKVFQTMSRKVLQDLKGAINGATDVLWYFIDQVIASEAYHENPKIYAPPEQLMEGTGQGRAAVYKHLKILVELKYIVKLRPHLYQVNPDFLFVGRAQPRLKAQLEFDALSRDIEVKEYALKEPETDLAGSIAKVIEQGPVSGKQLSGASPRRQRKPMHKRPAPR